MTSFFGVGAQSVTATEGGDNSVSRPATEAPAPGFSAFAGRGVSLGSDIENPSTKSSSSMFSNFRSSSNKTAKAAPEPPREQVRNPVSALDQPRDDKREGDPQATNDTSMEEEDNHAPFIKKKSGDARGTY